MTTTTVKPDLGAAFRAAFEAATATSAALRQAYRASADADRVLTAEAELEREAARRSHVDGVEHTIGQGIRDARASKDQATARVDELRRQEQAELRDLYEASAALAASDPTATPVIIGQLVDRVRDRVDQAVGEIIACTEQANNSARVIAHLGGSSRASLMTIGTVDVEPILRVGADLEQLAYNVTHPLPAPRPIQVSESEMLAWHVAAGGSPSDSVSEIREHYLERGPRSAEAAEDQRAIKHAEEALQRQNAAALRPTGPRTRDQRSW